jgi:hypothetical protein
VLDIPTSRVIAWSADRENPVGAEYILEERAPGKRLGSLWYQWPIKPRMKMIEQIVDLERKLASITFTKSGCVYFKDDIPENMAGEMEVATNVPIHSSVLQRFGLGPLVSSELWRDKRAGMDMNRGPCKCSLNNIFSWCGLTSQSTLRWSM